MGTHPAVRRLLAYRFTLLVLLGLLVSVAAERLSGDQLTLAPVLALTVPGWLALTALLAGGWALRRRRIALLPLAALVLAWPVQRGLPLHWAGRRGLAAVGAPPAPRSLRAVSQRAHFQRVCAFAESRPGRARQVHKLAGR